MGGGGGGPLGAPSHRNLASVLPSRPPCSFSCPPPALPQLRARDPASRGDRYMLVTFEEPPYAIKAGWKENHATFMNELKTFRLKDLRLWPIPKDSF
uniref:Uncharacterized protein n=1 Tax=Lynx canadensis TaxID=61383 RepID=A0A667G0U3_LYNCA